MLITYRRKLTLKLYLFLFLGLLSPLFAAPAHCDDFPADTIKSLNLPLVEDVELLYIDDSIKNWLDLHIAPLRRATTRATILHLMLFDPAYLGINYDGTSTKNAVETWRSKSGNCVSLASLYVAAARYVGLKAKFQTVKIPREWQEKEGFYVIPGHVNASIRLPKDTITVEFADIYPAAETQKFDSKKISDKHMLAEYYNNIGMEHLEKGESDLGMAYLAKSIDTYDRIDFVWSNLGVAFKLRKMYKEAEIAYKKALRLNRSSLSTLNNLYVLYVETKQSKASEKLRKKVTRYSRRNPFHLYRLAKTEAKLRNYDSAIHLLKRAIRIKPEAAKFHLLLGKIYFQTGNLIASSNSINRALKLTKNPEEIEKYQSKLQAIEKLRANL